MLKKLFYKSKVNNNSGIILLVVLWILVILSLFAVGVSRRTSIDLSLAKFGLGKLKSDFSAWAGFFYAFDIVRKDVKDKDSAKVDTLYQCGVKLDEEQVLEDIFKKRKVGDGVFDIAYQDEQGSRHYGFKDEERKINANAITTQNYKIMAQLLILTGVSEEEANVIAASMADWRDNDDTVTDNLSGAEDDYYMGLGVPYHCKNLPFDSIEELLLVKGMTREIFNQTRDYITVFPKGSAKSTPAVKVNINTAPEIIFHALGFFVLPEIQDAGQEDVYSMASKIIDYRDGDDDKQSSEDDQIVPINNLGDMEMTHADGDGKIYMKIKRYFRGNSRYIRVHIDGMDETSLARTHIEAVINAKTARIPYWKRN